MLQLPVLRSLGECGHPAEMPQRCFRCVIRPPEHLIGPEDQQDRCPLCWMAKPLSQPLAFSWSVPLCPECVEKSRCVGQRTKSQQAIRRHPHCPQEPRILPGCPLFASAFPVRLHCALASREGVFEFTQHTLCTEGLPHLGNRTGYFASFTCTVIVYII